MHKPEAKNFSTDLRSLGPQFIFIAFVLGFPFGIATTPIIFRDGDVSWQVAAGEWILRHGRIPTTDPFSFTAMGQPWVAMEWGGEIVYALAFKIAGYAGLATVVATCLIALNSAVFFSLQRRVGALALSTTLLMMTIVLGPFMLARPHVLAWPLLAAWTILLVNAADTGRPPPLWSALILLVWTNLHASFPMALVIAAALGLDALIKAKWTTVREWALFGTVSLVAVLLNANGVAGLLQPFKTSTLTMLSLIGEWQPSTPNATPFFYAALLLGMGTLFWSGIAIPIGRLLLLLVLLALAFAHVRHQSFFIIVAACVIPRLCPLKPMDSKVPKWLVLGALPLLAYRLAWPLSPPESTANPRQLIATIPSELRAQPVFNSYSFGGPLILAGIRPYIDGRGEIYGDAFVRDYVDVTHGDLGAFNRAVQRYDIRWTLLAKSDKRLIDAIESSGDWQRLYSDNIGVIDVRKSGRRPNQTAASPGWPAP